MESSASTSRNDSTLAKPFGQLSLRVHGTQYDGQVIQLQGPKFTIGSGGNCTLRLNARGVAPVQFLIYRGLGQTIVRPWADSSRLNGAAFVDAPLSVGDRLGFGPIEFEVIESSAAEGAATLPVAKAEHRAEFSTESASIVHGAAADVTELRDRLELANRQGRRRARKLIEKMRDFERRQLRLAAERQSLSHDQQHVAAQRDQFAVQRQQFDAQQQQADQQLTAASQRISAQSHELRAKLAELATQRDALMTERAACDQQQRVALLNIQNAEADLTARRHRLTEELNQFAGERRKLETTRAVWQAEQAAVAMHAAEQSRQLDLAAEDIRRKQADLDAAQQAWQMQQQRLEGQLQASEQQIDQLREQLSIDQAALAAQQRSMLAEQQHHQLELEQAAADLRRRSSELDQRQGMLELQSEQLQSDRVRWESERAELRQDLGNQSENLRRQIATLEDERQAFFAIRDRWQSEQHCQQSELADRQTALQNQLDQLTLRERTLGQEQSQWAAQCQQSADQFADQQQQFSRQASEIEQRQLDLEHLRSSLHHDGEALLAQRVSLEIAQRELTTAIESHRAETAVAQLADGGTASGQRDAGRELELRQAELDLRQTELEARLAEMETRGGELQTWQAMLDARQHDLETAQADLSAQRDQLAARHDQLAADRAALHALQAELHSYHDQFAARQTEFETQRADLALQALELQSRQTEFESRQSEPTNRIAPASDSDAPPASGSECEPLSVIEQAAVRSVDLNAGLHGPQSGWEAERGELLGQLQQLREEIERLQAELAIRRLIAPSANLAADAADIEHRPLATDSDSQSLQNGWTQLAGERQAFAADMQLQRHELDQRSATLDARSAQLEQQLEQLLEHREHLANQANTWNEVKAAEELQLQTQAEQLSQAQAQLQALADSQSRHPAASWAASESAGSDAADDVSSNQPAALHASGSQDDDHDLIEREAAAAALQWRRGPAQAEVDSILALSNGSDYQQHAATEPEFADSRAELLADDQPTGAGPSESDAADVESPGERDIFARLRALALLKNDTDSTSESPQSNDSRASAESRSLSAYERFSQNQAQLAAQEAADADRRSGGSPMAESSSIAHDRCDSDTNDEANEDAADERAQPQRAAHPSASGDSETGEEESVEDYMARLLNRMRSDKPTASSVSKSEAPSKPAPVAKPIEPVVAEPQLEPLKSLPRSQAPEFGADLSAMRELANQSARAAIHTHQRKSIVLRVAEQSAVGAGVAALGGGLVWWSNLKDTTPLYGGLGAVTFGLAWIGWALFKVLSIGSRPAEASSDDQRKLSQPAKTEPAAL